MNIEVITREDCPFCVKVKEYLKENQIQYTETQIGRDIMREVVVARFPEAKTVPIIVLNGQRLPDLEHLKHRLSIIKSSANLNTGSFNGN